MSDSETQAGPAGTYWSPGVTGVDDLLEEALWTRPDRPALVVTGERVRMAYGDLSAVVDALSAALGDGGLHPGDTIALVAENTAEFVAGLLGAARAGLVVAPINPALPTVERAARLDQIGARVALAGKALDGATSTGGSTCPTWQLSITAGPWAVDLKASPAPRTVTTGPSDLSEEDAVIMFSAGTTDRPKMIPWTHTNIAASVQDICSTYELGPADATVAVMPFSHGHGLTAALLASLASGGCVLLPERGRFTAHTFWDDVQAVGATWFTAVPTIHQILLRRAAAEYPGREHAPLRFVRSCSAPLHPETARALEQIVEAPVLSAYGMTETTHQTTSEPLPANGPRANGSVGRSTGVDMRIVADDGHDCPADVVGEIWVRGPTVVRGYLENPRETSLSFVDGWYRTGDLGMLDSGGYLTITGRIKALINRGGEKISPEHVESVLDDCPGVAEAAVFGASDPKYGERTVALVVALAGQTVSRPEVMTYCETRLASFEVPDDLKLVDALPHTAKGALNRQAIAASYSR